MLCCLSCSGFCLNQSYTFYKSREMEFGVWPQMENSGGLIQSCVFPYVPRYIFIHALTHIHTHVHMNPSSCCSWQSHPGQQLIHKHHTHPPQLGDVAGLCSPSVSMAIKVASDNGYFLSAGSFGNFSSIRAQTSNGQSRSGSLWLVL